MKREDLRSRIIPTTIDNTDESQNTGNKKFNTTDLIYLDSYNEQYDGKIMLVCMMAILRVLVGKQFWRGFAPPVLDTMCTV